MNTRLIYIDNLKAFAIFLVFLGHSIQYLGYEWGGAYNCLLFNVIYSFHMPLFMALSGYFFASSLKMPFVEMLKKKSLYILLPSLIWSIPKVVFTHNMIGSLIYNLWFLKSVWLCYILFYLLFATCKGNKYLVGLLAFVISFTIPLDIFPGYLNWMIPCFYLGVLLRNYQDYINRNITLLIISSAIYIISFTLTQLYGYMSNEYFALLQKLIFNFAGTISIITLFTWLNKSKEWISFIGGNTLPLYAMNILFCDVITHVALPDLSENKILVILVISTATIIQFIIYPLFVKQFEKSAITKLLLLGKK